MNRIADCGLWTTRVLRNGLMRTFGVLLLAAASTAAARQPARFEFSIANIMRGPEVEAE
jgi:hypothetical protein